MLNLNQTEWALEFVLVSSVVFTFFLFLGPHSAFQSTIRYDTVDWKAEYSALSSTRSQKEKLKQTTPVRCGQCGVTKHRTARTAYTARTALLADANGG